MIQIECDRDYMEALNKLKWAQEEYEPGHLFIRELTHSIETYEDWRFPYKRHFQG